VYKFDTNMNPLEPVDDSLRQIHTSGTFLEKTDLLKKAMESVKEWEDNVPGTKGSSLPNVAKRMTTMENALLQLKEEQQVWSRLEDGSENNDNDDDIIVPHSANNDSSNHEERFEEMSNISTNPSEKIEANMKAVNSRDDPVVVFIRHGRTPHNKLALFTGWEDPPLAEEGEEDARWAGRLLKEHGFEFDVVYTSWLFRAIQTAYFALEELDQLYLPLVKSWRLNERHYGDLTGKSKKMIANIHGEEQLKRWRKGYKVRPPPVSSYSFNYPGNDKRRAKYVKDLPISITETFCRSFEDRKLTIHRKFPKCESLFDCMNRSIPFYTQKIVPEAVAQGKRVLITSHENAIRGILMHLCDIPEDCMNDLHLPNGVPLVYNVKRRCISLLDEGSNEDPVEKYDFGSAAKYLFRACEIEDDSS
jgi:2,3-bisphosphoglycerate-dependent phosphoglycerate mutase